MIPVQIRGWKRRKLISKANGEWKFLFSLAKELGKTLAELTETLTREELIGWAAYFALQNEEMDKERDAVQAGAASRVQSR